MRVFISDLSGVTMVVDAHIMPQTALHATNLFNRDGSIGYFILKIAKYNRHVCTITLHISHEIARSVRLAKHVHCNLLVG